MSTVSISESIKIAKEFQEHNIDKLDIPVMGGPNVAITGELVMMASGDREVFDWCRNIFESIANKVFFLGKNGDWEFYKISNEFTDYNACTCVIGRHYPS